MKKDNPMIVFQIGINEYEYVCPVAISAPYQIIALTNEATKPSDLPKNQVIKDIGIT